MSLYTLTVDLLLKNAAFERDAGKSERIAEKTARAARKMQREVSDSFSRAAQDAKVSITSIDVSMATLAKGFGLIGGGVVFGKFITETVNAQNEMAQLNAILKSTGQAAGYSSQQLVEMASRMAKATTHSSGEIVEAQTRLLSYSSIVGENFPRALQLAIDQSVRLGESVTQSAETVGKALEYPAEGISALTKQGFRFTEQQKDMLKSMAETGRLAEAQAMVMEVMEESYAGAGLAARETLGGALTAVNKSFDDLLGNSSNSGGITAATVAINYFADNMDKVAAAALPLGAALAVFYAGGKLQKGLVTLNALWTAHSVVANRAAVGLTGMAAATTRLTAAQTAAAISARGLSSAYALIGGTVGVAAAGVTAIGYGVYLAAQAAGENKARFYDLKVSLDDVALSAEKVRDALAGGAETREAVETFAKLSLPIRDAQNQLEGLRAKLAQLRDDARLSTRNDGASALAIFPQIEATEKAIADLEARLKPAEGQFDSMETALRTRLGPAFGDVRAAVEQLKKDGNWDAFAKSIGPGATEAIGEISRLEERFKSLSGTIRDGILSLPGQIERIGKSAKEVATLDLRDMLQAGIDSGQLKPGTDAWDKAVADGTKYIQYRTQQERAQKAFADTRRMNASADKAAVRDGKARAESVERYTRAAQLAAAVMDGPLREAEVKHAQREVELNQLLKEGNITRDSHNILLRESEQALARSTAEIEKAQRAPERLIGTMQQEVQLLGLAGPARELYRRQLQNEADMREEITRAQEAGAKLGEDEIAQLMARARGYATLSMEMEEAARAAEDWQHVAVDAAGGVADVFSDVFAGQIKNAKDFFSELKDVFKRGWWDVIRTSLQQQFVNPIQKAIQGMLSGQGFAAAGSNYGSLGTTIAGSIVQGAQRAGIGALGVGSTLGAGTDTIAGFGNNMANFGGYQGQLYGFGGLGGAGSGGSGFGFGGFGLPSKSLLTGEFAGGLPYASAALGLMGAYYGLTQRGSGGLSSILAGASYGALGVGVGGAIAGGLGAIGTGVGIGGVGAGAAAGATGAMGAIGAASWVPVVGWALAAAAVIDKVSGGKLFGTKYKTDSSQQTVQITDAGGFAAAQAEQSRQKALFGGKKRRTVTVDPGQEARDAAAGMHEVLAAYAKQLGASLRQDAVALVGGSFSQTYDKKGNVTGSRSTVLGRSYDEDVETFQKRLAAEQAIAAVAKIDEQASRIAEDWRKSADLLEEGANFFVTAAVDARSGMDLWTGVGLTALTDYVEKMQAADEDLAAAYSRLAGTAKSYGELMADIATQVMTADLTGYQQQALGIERTYRQQVKAANDYAKALGLTGARAEDLAKIEELRALQMGKLQAQIEADKKSIRYGLSVSDLSPLTDQQKLTEAMQALADATAKGDSQATQQAAQAALGFGRNLYASGNDYSDLYGRVTSMIDGMKIGDLDLEDGMSMGQLADAIEALPEQFGRSIFEVAAGGKEEQQQTNAKLDEQSQLLREHNDLLQKLLNTTQGAASVQKRESLNASLNAR